MQNHCIYELYFWSMKKINNENIKPTDKICYNCNYLGWHIALGLGLRCWHPARKEEGKIGPLVPGRFHTCELFEYKKNKKNE